MTHAYRYSKGYYHDHCLVRATYMKIYEGRQWPNVKPEVYLDRAAQFKKIDRTQEGSFTEDQFPKRMTDNEIDVKMTCSFCKKKLQEGRS